MAKQGAMNKTGTLAEQLADALASEQQRANVYQEDINPDDYHESPVILNDDEKTLLDIIDELTQSDNTIVRVYREIKGQPLQFLYQPDMSPDLLGDVMNTLQEHYGEGTYRIQARARGNSLKLNRAISVGKSLKPKITEQVQTPQNNGNDMMQMLLAMQNESKKDMQQMFLMMMNSQNEAMKAIAGRPVPEQHSDGLTVKDILALLPTLKDLMGNKNDGSQIDLFLKGLEMGKSLEGGGESGLGELAKGALSTIATAVSSAQQNRQANPIPAQPIAPQSRQIAPQSRQIAPQPQPEPDQGAGMDDLKSLVRVLVNAARKQADPAAYTDMVLDMLGDEPTIELCSSPANIQQLLLAFPELAPYEGWVFALAAEIIILTDEPAGDIVGDIDNETHHATDPENNPPLAGDAPDNV